MSIIFDALKRAETQRQKGQTPSLASTRAASNARPRLRIWALASLFVALGLSAWWFRTSPELAEATVTAASPNAKPVVVDVSADKLTPRQSSAQADLSLAEAPGVVPAAVVATDLRGNEFASAEIATSGATRLTVPSLDTPLTGAAQFDKQREPVAVIAPVLPATPMAPAPVQPDLLPELVNAKPVEVVEPVAAVPAAMPATAAEAGSPPVLPSIFELEYQLRHDLPKMAVSMYVYNAQQQYRFVIIGGKRYAEGEQIESKVTVTKIRADGIECEFQGTRFFYPRQSL